MTGTFNVHISKGIVSLNIVLLVRRIPYTMNNKQLGQERQASLVVKALESWVEFLALPV